MNAQMKKISIVSGCYNEEDNIPALLSQLRTVIAKHPAYEFEIIVIDNASVDASAKVLRAEAAKDFKVKVILNARNFGHVRSPFHAMLQASGDAVVCLASDLQDPPELISRFIEKWEQGFQAAVAIKNQSEETPAFFLIRKAYYGLINRLAETETLQNFTGFGLYDRQIIDICRKINDPYPYFRGLITEIGFPVAKIPFMQPLRKRGITKNNFYTLYDIAMLGITNHSKIPLRLATMLGFAMSILSFALAVAYLIYKLIYWNKLSVGIAPMIIGLFFFGSVQLFFIGILGEYIGAIHTQVLHRPLVFEKERINF